MSGPGYGINNLPALRFTTYEIVDKQLKQLKQFMV